MARGKAVYAGLAHRENALALQEAVHNLTEYHISAVRMNRARGITFVKHIAYGWMSVKDYYLLQKVHDLVPFATQIIQGGYDLKSRIWATEIPLDILASGSAVPFGFLLLTGAIGFAYYDFQNGNQWAGVLDLVSLVLPFGEFWLIYRLWLSLSGLDKNVNASGVVNDPWLILLEILGPGGLYIPASELLTGWSLFWSKATGQIGTELGDLWKDITGWF